MRNKTATSEERLKQGGKIQDAEREQECELRAREKNQQEKKKETIQEMNKRTVAKHGTQQRGIRLWTAENVRQEQQQGSSRNYMGKNKNMEATTREGVRKRRKKMRGNNKEEKH